VEDTTVSEVSVQVTDDSEQTQPVAASAPVPVSDAEGGSEVGSPPEAVPDPSSAPAAPALQQVDSAPGKPANAERKPRASRSRRKRAASLYRSFRTGRALEGKVERAIKGGYEVRLGRVRGFCPRSQIDVGRAAKPEDYVGQSLLFRITQLRRGGDDVVVSRRVLLEEDRADEAKAVRATLIEGSVMQGRVSSIAGFGAFVDLGAGVMGLVHLSELSHGRVNRVEEVVEVGEQVQVKILKVDEELSRISLSLRQAQRDPWDEVAERYRVGRAYPGVATRLAGFGAFVELEPGVEALAPASEFPPMQGGWKGNLGTGKERRWMVLSVDPEQRRMSVVPLEDGEDPAELPALEIGATLRGKVQRIEKFGVFVWLGPGRVGLMPNAMSGTARGADVARCFPVADEIEVVVLEIGDDGRRIRLAKKGVRTGPEPRPREAAEKARRGRKHEPPPRDRSEQAAPSSRVATPFGSLLADKLRAALDQPNRSS
jgi:small subunit ribosomal protein S1